MAKFVWLRDSAFPRTGPRLEKGKEHDVEPYGQAVVNEWVKQGVAEMVPEGAPALKLEKKEKAAKVSGGRQK